MDLGLILATKFYDKRWTVSGEGKYADIIWHDNSKKPTEKELEDLWPIVQIEVHNNEMRLLRQRAYEIEADSLFFDYQRGEVEKQEWLDKVSEIRERYPYTSIS